MSALRRDSYAPAMGLYASLARWVGDKPWFRPVARNVLPAVDRFLGRVGLRATPWPTMILTTTGRKSGDPRDTPLYFVDPLGNPAVIGTNYGRPVEPHWSLNLRNDASCSIKNGRHTTQRRARLATAGEWEPIFAKFAAFYPSYRAYRERAGRDIPIWVFEPHA